MYENGSIKFNIEMDKNRDGEVSQPDASTKSCTSLSGEAGKSSAVTKASPFSMTAGSASTAATPAKSSHMRAPDPQVIVEGTKIIIDKRLLEPPAPLPSITPEKEEAVEPAREVAPRKKPPTPVKHKLSIAPSNNKLDRLNKTEIEPSELKRKPQSFDLVKKEVQDKEYQDGLQVPDTSYVKGGYHCDIKVDDRKFNDCRAWWTKEETIRDIKKRRPTDPDYD